MLKPRHAECSNHSPATLRRDRQLADHLGLNPGMLLVRIQLALSMRLWRNLVGRTTLRTWAFGRVSSSLTSRTLFESWSARLSVKQAAQNRAVAPNGSIPSRLTCSDCGWCRSRFHKPVCQIRFLKSLYIRVVQRQGATSTQLKQWFDSTRGYSEMRETVSSPAS